MKRSGAPREAECVSSVDMVEVGERRTWEQELLAELRLLRQAIERTAKSAEGGDDSAPYTLDEVAKKLDVSKRQLLTLRSPEAKPRLRTITIGKRGVRVTRQDYDDFIERRRQAAAIPPVSKRRRR